MAAFKDITGRRFGRLIAISPTTRRAWGGGVVWLCRCDCGANAELPSNALATGNTKSCGCIGHARHGMTGSRTHDSWSGMRSRCTNKKSKDWPQYGGRGISICRRWNTFENFLSDMGQRPKGLSLDRIDVNGNYEPDNCRWATNTRQQRNRRCTRFIEHCGKRQSINDWAVETGIAVPTLRARFLAGDQPPYLFRRQRH